MAPKGGPFQCVEQDIGLFRLVKRELSVGPIVVVSPHM